MSSILDEDETQDIGCEDQDMGLDDQTDPTQARRSSGSVRRRGPSKLIWISFGKPMPLEFNNDCLPIGKHGRYFNSYLASLARNPNLFPVNIFNWHFMPKHRLNQAWTAYSSTIAWTPKQLGEGEEGDLDIREEVREKCERKLGDCWRKYKCDLKKNYYNNAELGSRPIICGDKTMPVEQWNDLVKYWDSARSKELAEINRNNRKNVNMPHTSGSCGYATLIQKFIIENQHEPNEMEFYALVHKRKDKTWITDEAERHNDNMEARLEKLPQETQHTPEAKRMVFREEFADKMVGHGRVFGHGVGIRPNDLGLSAASSSSSSSARRSSAEIAVLQTQFNESQAIRESQQVEIRELREIAERSETARQRQEAEMRELREKTERSEALLQQLLNRMAPPSRAYRDNYRQEYGETWHTPLSPCTPTEPSEQV